MKNIRLLLQSLTALLAFTLTSLVHAGTFLPPDEAFHFTGTQNGQVIELKWKIEHGYYLYEKRIYSYIENADANIDLPLNFISHSEIKQDKNFGPVPVFFDVASASVDINSIKPDSANKTVTIEYQGCAKDGLCYQPQTRTIVVNADATISSATAAVAKPVSAASGQVVLKPVAASFAIPVASPAVTTNQAGPVNVDDLTSTGKISKFLEHASLLSTIGIFLLLGIGLSLTPCILPMIPILSGIIVGHGDKLTARHGILLSSAYVLGMATSYAFAGILAATFGAQGNLQAYMQNPWVIGIFSLVFVALALSMFGLYTLALPSRLQNALYNLSNKQKGGHFFGVYVMGALSALVVSPCVSAPLAGALVFISSTGDKLIGGLALFALGIGMGLPLIAIGAGGGKLVPKAGMWMNHVKHFFGVVLLGVAIWLLSRIIPAQVSMILWALLLITYGIYNGALIQAEAGIARLGNAANFILLLYGCILFLGAFTGGTSPMEPIKFSQQLSHQQGSEAGVLAGTSAPIKAVAFKRIKNNDELTHEIQLAKEQHKTVMFDFYADWCTACIDMERNVFSKAIVQAALKDFVLLQIDVTHNTKDDKMVLDRFKLFGPPSMLFFKNGEQLKDKSLQGEMPAADFMTHIQNI